MLFFSEVKYLGCYVDDSSRMLDVHNQSNQMTLEMCKQSCHKHRYLGLQNHNHCFCGKSLGDSNRYQKKKENECLQPCGGNLSQTCGGFWRNSVYEFIPVTVPTTKMTTPGHSTVKTTDMNTSRQSTVTTTEMTTNIQSSVTTTEILWLGQSEVTTTHMKTYRQSPVTTIQITEPGASEVTTFETTPEVTSVQPLDCLCPCFSIAKGKWDFLRGMNLTLDQLREVMKPELDLMKKELSVNKSNTTRMRRSKISAPDDRVSATSVGYVGIVFICLITLLIVFIDIIGCFASKFKRQL
ncbi:Hypothetical predicted protein [Mytilus galloprovincialis]|uniref:WSC domain-containing protein n=1 Tax=Mytilus galloprovincialis TaxID=29158 RepID=A0A8B6DKZ6_MYTGA|nr:Hypothetical predicted protein [Mytilus galloprovincialis]